MSWRPRSGRLAGGFVSAYKAHCDRMGMTPVDIGPQVRECAERPDRVFRLDGMIRHTVRAEGQSPLDPLYCALQHCGFWRGIRACGTAFQGDVGRIAEVVQHNTGLVSLEVADTRAERGWTDLGVAMVVNASCQSRLESLDFSGARMNDRSAAVLSQGLATLNSLTYLDVSRCSLSTRGVGLIFEALADSPTHYASLRRLCISGTSFGKSGSDSLASWLSGLRPGESKLEDLDLGGCDLNLSLVLSALRESCRDCLRKLSIECSPVSERSLEALESLLESGSLSTLCLSGCQLSAESAVSLLEAVGRRNGTHEGLDLDLSDNPMGCPALFSKAIAETKRVVSLRLAGTGLEAEELCGLCDALAVNRTLTSLDLSRNLQFKGAAVRRSMERLSWALCRNPRLHSLKLQGRPGIEVGPDIVPLFSCLRKGSGCALAQLDVSYQSMEDSAAKELFAALAENEFLTTLGWEGNAVSFDVLPAMADALRTNRTLCDTTIAMGDARLSFSFYLHSNSSKDLEELDKITRQVAAGLSRNRDVMSGRSVAPHTITVKAVNARFDSARGRASSSSCFPKAFSSLTRSTQPRSPPLPPAMPPDDCNAWAAQSVSDESTAELVGKERIVLPQLDLSVTELTPRAPVDSCLSPAGPSCSWQRDQQSNSGTNNNGWVTARQSSAQKLGSPRMGSARQEDVGRKDVLPLTREDQITNRE